MNRKNPNAQALFQQYKIDLNLRELKLMEQEQVRQKGRADELGALDDILQRRRLSKIHAVERARFQEFLSTIVQKHEKLLQKFASDLGLKKPAS